jgi:hypothetical protein
LGRVLKYNNIDHFAPIFREGIQNSIDKFALEMEMHPGLRSDDSDMFFFSIRMYLSFLSIENRVQDLAEILFNPEYFEQLDSKLPDNLLYKIKRTLK